MYSGLKLFNLIRELYYYKVTLYKTSTHYLVLIMNNGIYALELLYLYKLEVGISS